MSRIADFTLDEIVFPSSLCAPYKGFPSINNIFTCVVFFFYFLCFFHQYVWWNSAYGFKFCKKTFLSVGENINLIASSQAKLWFVKLQIGCVYKIRFHKSGYR